MSQKSSGLVINSLAYLIAIAPAILCLWYVKNFAVDVPFWDEWIFVDLLRHVYAGTTSWLCILHQQCGENLVGIPYLFMFWLAKCTHYDVRAEMFLGWFFLVSTWVLVLKIAADRLPNNHWHTITLIPISWLICSLRQYETLLWGAQIQTPISIFFFVLAIYLLDRASKHKCWPVGLAALSGVCGTFSFGNGFLIWPLGTLQLLLKNLWAKDSDRSSKPLIIWFMSTAIAGLVIFCCYARAYLGTCPYGLAPILCHHHYWSIVGFFIAYLASPVIATVNDNIANSYPDIVVSQGLVLCGIYAAAIVFAFRQAKELGTKLLVPLILMSYTVASDCITIIARAGGGINQALASRYTSISCLGIVGAYLILLIINKPSAKVRAFLLGALLTPVFASMIMCTKVGIEEGRRIWVQRTLLSYVVLSHKQQNPRLFPFFMLPENFKELSSFLEANRLSVFHHPHKNLYVPAYK